MADNNKKIKYILITISLMFILIVLFLPLITIVVQALKDGIGVYIKSVSNEYTIKALKLTLLVLVTCVFVNTIFGLIAAWAITKYEFKFKGVIMSLIDLPFAISPVVTGLLFVLYFGRGSFIYDLLQKVNLKIIFTPIAIVIVSLFVTMPYVVKELVPLMRFQGKEEEEAAALMGAGGLKIFMKITLPKIKWGLFYGITLCAARAMGEFGAVSVVSGHIRGVTNTLPLEVEVLYNQYEFSAAFAVSSILVILAIIILIIRNIIVNKGKKVM